MRRIIYEPKGVCSSLMEIVVDGDKIVSVSVEGGCSGNLQAVSRLVEGMRVSDAVSRLEGIRCGWKATSCPDQLARALRSLMSE